MPLRSSGWGRTVLELEEDTGEVGKAALAIRGNSDELLTLTVRLPMEASFQDIFRGGRPASMPEEDLGTRMADMRPASSAVVCSPTPRGELQEPRSWC